MKIFTGKDLKTLRGTWGLSQEKICKLAGLSRSSVSMAESQTHVNEPLPPKLQEVAEIFWVGDRLVDKIMAACSCRLKERPEERVIVSPSLSVSRPTTIETFSAAREVMAHFAYIKATINGIRGAAEDRDWSCFSIHSEEISDESFQLAATFVTEFADEYQKKDFLMILRRHLAAMLRKEFAGMYNKTESM